MSGGEDLDGLWRLAQRGLPSALIWEAFGIGATAPPGAMRRALRWRRLLGALPIEPEGESYFEVMPLELARPRHWRLVVAVRDGMPYAYGGDPVHQLPRRMTPAAARGLAAVWGSELLDIAAIPANGRGKLRVLRGTCCALGDPWGLAAEDGAPAPIARDIAQWLGEAITGAMLPLPPTEAAMAYLRGLTAGIVAADIDHGLVLERLLRVPAPPMPKLLVRQPARNA